MRNEQKKFIFKSRFTRSNRIPQKRSRYYLVRLMCTYRRHFPSAALKGALGLLHWLKARKMKNERRISPRVGCFLTGRNRGTIRRFSIARTRIKELSSRAQLIGLRKSSW